MIEKTYMQFRAHAAFEQGSDSNPAGREIAEFLVKELPVRGIDTDAPIQEDWGWCFYANIEGVRCLVGCGLYLEFDDGWLTFVDPAKLSWSYWFKRGAVVSACKRVAATVRGVLGADARFYDLQWWSDPAGVSPTAPALRT